MNKAIKRVWAEHKSFAVFLILMVVFRSSFADWNYVPTGSMQPTIVEGDRILINKLAYDIHLPLSSVSIAKLADPERGDIVIFNSKVTNTRLVKRVIGIPGDLVEMRKNVLFINNKKLDYQTLKSSTLGFDMKENLLGIEHLVRIRAANAPSASFSKTLVPEGMYLVLGDNRDNSADSRFIGFVPRDEIIGRSKTVVMSLDTNKYYLPRGDRFFKPL